MPKPSANLPHETSTPSTAKAVVGALPDPSEAGLKPAEYGQYGMRTDAAGGRGSDHGAASDHESFDGEFSTREARNPRARSIPTGLSHAPAVPEPPPVPEPTPSDQNNAGPG